jgi:hypothetical protein
MAQDAVAIRASANGEIARLGAGRLTLQWILRGLIWFLPLR